jgi:hypothetical protein
MAEAEVWKCERTKHAEKKQVSLMWRDSRTKRRVRMYMCSKFMNCLDFHAERTLNLRHQEGFLHNLKDVNGMENGGGLWLLESLLRTAQILPKRKISILACNTKPATHVPRVFA